MSFPSIFERLLARLGMSGSGLFVASFVRGRGVTGSCAKCIFSGARGGVCSCAVGGGGLDFFRISVGGLAAGSASDVQMLSRLWGTDCVYVGYR